MGQAAAMAGVTLALRTLLEAAFAANAADDRHLADVLVTTVPPDRARHVHHRCQLNITLAAATASSGRGAAPLGLRASSAKANPGAPQPVDLLYLLTAYGPEDDELMAQRVMGVAMRTLHLHPVLGPIDLDVLFPHTGASGTLDALRLTQAPVSREQIVAWGLAFHTPYRLSTAWHVSGASL